MQPIVTTHPPRRKIAAWAAVAALAVSSAVALSPLSASTAQASETTYPWSKVAGTGDYIADSYADVGGGHVFENLTTDRLLDVLSSNGNYYIVFAGPEHAASRALVPVVNDAALANGITKIYHFDPYVDGYQLDSTLENGVPDVTGGTSVNFGGTAKLSDVWKLVTSLLPASTTASGGALHEYAGDTALLLNVNITNRKDVETGKVVTKLAEVTESDAAAFAADTAGVKTATAAALASAFQGKTASVRGQFAFFERLYNASATKTEGSTATADRIGSEVTLFDPADYPSTGDFRLKSIDVKELYNLLNSPGEFPILFAGQGCHNTQAIIASVAERAKELNVPVVYVVDFALDSNVKFGTGDDIDRASANSATGGLWIRSGSAALATTTPFRYGYSYLYGKIAEYFGPDWITENSSKKNNSVAYYPNAVLGETSTVIPYSGGSDNPAFNPATSKANATRLQVPTLVRYNKDASGGPIVGHWLHKDNVGEGATQTYTEYMLELAWVRQTALTLADTSRSTGRDGLTKAEFAAEAVAALDGVLKADTTVTHTFTTAPTPTVDGDATIGSTLEGYWGEWSQNPDLAYQWLADEVAIPGATADSYTLTSQEAGKRITFAVTASRAGYQTTTKTSAPTAQVGTFAQAPIPTIEGSPIPGYTLGLNTGNWSPAASFSFQWNADGKPISGATKNQYTVQTADLGKQITVTVTGSATGQVTTSRTSAPTAKVAYPLEKTPTPKIKGTAKVGKTLTVTTGTWSPKVSFSYQWEADGVAIAKATKASYKIAPAQAGKKITVTVTGKKANYTSVSKTSAATKKVASLAFTKKPAPKITGTAKVGKTLKVKLGTWAPKSGTKFSYAWFASGKAIPGATSSTLKLTSAQKGKKITVKVTAKKTGYTTTTKPSKATAKVK
ncbi:MAG: hypothetical protein KIT69_04320 [Propionibacteriaceae bacterium]|nr:hypothetical protein [Propionibacteriaceae bacterium]